MSQDALPRHSGGWAIFLDLDGTLVENGETSEGVRIPGSLKHELNSLCVRLDGALALVSGSRIAELDALFAPYRFCAAGVHGSETRDASGCLLIPPHIDAKSFDVARGLLMELVGRHPELLLEDKRFGLALHFRRAPHLRVIARTAMESMVNVLGHGFQLQARRDMYEIYPAAWTKATAIAAFMARRPFEGRTPVLMSDDPTGEDALALVNAADGITVKIGDRSASVARYGLADMAAAVEWLASIPPVTPPGSACAETSGHGRSRRDS